MSQQLFLKKLYQIRPFKEIQSPREHKFISFTNQQNIINPSEITKQNYYKLTDSQLYIQPTISESQMITNLRSNFDQLFEKISKIKDEFQSQKSNPDKAIFIEDEPKVKLPYENVLKKVNSIENQPKLQPLFCHKSHSLNFNENKRQNQANFQIGISYFPRIQQLNSEKQKKIFETKTSHQIEIPSMTNNIKIFETKTSHQIEIPSMTNNINYKMFEAINLKISDFELGKSLGSGKFGDVFIGKHKATNSIFAIKKIFKSTLVEYKMVEQFLRELKIHYSLDHPNIIKLYTHFDDQYHIFLVMEYADGGMLMDHLNKGQQYVSKVLQQMLNAVQYLQKNKIAHRDIKPQNIVICHHNTMKLCDFGWASTFENQMKTTFCGTLDYVSPQMKDKGQYTMGVDIWSLGVLTFQLLCGFAPYKHEITNWRMKGGSRNMQWNWNILYPPYLTPLTESFMRGILKQNPQDRFTVRVCKNHLFIKKYTEDFSEENLLNLQLMKLFK